MVGSEDPQKYKFVSISSRKKKKLKKIPKRNSFFANKTFNIRLKQKKQKIRRKKKEY